MSGIGRIIMKDSHPLNYVVTPGDYLREWLEDRGITGPGFAFMTGIDAGAINGILNGSRTIDPLMADRLGSSTGIPAKAWIKLQNHYDSERRRLQL